MPTARRAAASRAAAAVDSVKGESEGSTTLPLTWEARIRSKHKDALVVGVDEAGRGPLAGPVVAAAALVFPAEGALTAPVLGINDSKQVSEEDRERIFEELLASKRIVYGAAVVDHETIDRINILQATMLAMTQAVAALAEKLAAMKTASPGLHVLIDGPRVPEAIASAASSDGRTSAPSSKRPRVEGRGESGAGALPEVSRLPSLAGAEAIVKGDAKVYSIAAASIIAKVTRDRIMREFDRTYPAYGFLAHKGYGTAAHMSAIYKHGPCPIHRKTFAPVSSYYPELSSAVRDDGGADEETVGTTARKAPSKAKASAAGRAKGGPGAPTTPSATVKAPSRAPKSAPVEAAATSPGRRSPRLKG